MKILIVGGGGREHAVAWSVSRSPKVTKIYCAPGNAGIGEYAECVNIGAMEFEKLADFAQEQAIDLTIIGMDRACSSARIWRRPGTECGLSWKTRSSEVPGTPWLSKNS